VFEPLRKLGILDALRRFDRRGKDLPAGIFIGRLAVDTRIRQLRRLGALVERARKIAPDRIVGVRWTVVEIGDAERILRTRNFGDRGRWKEIEMLLTP